MRPRKHGRPFSNRPKSGRVTLSCPTELADLAHEYPINLSELFRKALITEIDRLDTIYEEKTR